MQKSLFKKYLLMTMSIVLASFVVLGTMMMLFFSNFWQAEKEALLYKNVNTVAEIASGYTSIDELDESRVNIEIVAIGFLLNVLSRNIDSDIFITDLEGNRLIGSFVNEIDENVKKIDMDIIAKVRNSGEVSTGTLGGLYYSDQYIVAQTFVLPGTEQEVGIVFAATNTEGVFESLYDTFQVFLIAALVSLLLTFIVVWMFSYRMIRPLRRMYTAAKAFATGDFSVRVPVESSDEVGQLSIAFNNMANSLANSEGMRRSFIANVSHELKTPMTTIAGFIDGILDGTIPPEKQTQYLRIVTDEVKRLSRLVKSMLDLSRIDNGEMKLNPVKFDITHTVFNAILTFEQKIEQKNIEIKGLADLEPIMVDGDQDLLHQVIYNLIENAVKFTNPEGYISFVFTDSFDRVCISIENSGHGIPADDLPMIFDKFYKTDKSRSENKNGMGLGLYLVKTIIKLHGGDICVQSAVDGFSRFDMYIPKLIQKAPKNPEQGLAEVDDDSDIQDVE